MFLLGAFLFLGGCRTVTAYHETVTLSATVKYTNLEGGFYFLHGDNGVDYDPDNLPVEYRQDGKRVKAKLRIREDLSSTHMAGIIVNVLEISAIP